MSEWAALFQALTNPLILPVSVGGPASSHHSLSPAFNTSVKSEPDARSNSPPENCVSNVIPKYVPPKRRRLAGPERTSGVKEEWSEGSAPCSPQAVTPPATPNTRPSVEDAGGGGSGGGGGSNSNSSGDISRRGDENMRSDKEREEETPPATPGCSTWPNLAAITANHLRVRQAELASQEPYINGLVQERSNSSALAMELCLSCTNPSI